MVGEVHGSLFESVIDAGEKPELAMRLAEIFGWDLDFYTDPRPGDTFRVVVEKKILLNGEVLSYGRILAAEYINARPRRIARCCSTILPETPVFHAGRKVHEEGVSAFAAQVRRAHHFAFQRAASIPS